MPETEVPGTSRPHAGASAWGAGRRIYAFAIFCLIGMFNTLDRQIITVLIEPIKHTFGASDTAMGFLAGMAFAMFYVAASLPIARWADIGVRRSVMALCLGFWSLMTALGGAAQSYAQLALTRIGVAIGEAGAMPCIHSMLADLFPLHRRTTAVGVLNAMQSIGIALGVFLGGWLSDLYDWRVALFVVGVPGIVLAVVLRLTVAEPPRGLSDARAGQDSAPPLAEVFRHMWGLRSYRCIVLLTMFGALTGSGSLGWGPTFFIRVHGLSLTEAGLWFGIVTASSLVIGNLISGTLVDFLCRRDLRWSMWVAGCGPLLAAPFGAATALWPTPAGAFAFYFMTLLTLSVHLPPAQAMVQNVAPARMRGVAIVVVSMLMTLVGVGLGPLIIGLGNDLLRPAFGAEAVRYSLLFVMLGAVGCSGMAFLGTRWIREDVERARSR